MDIQTLIPDNYSSFIASITLVVAIICLFISFSEKQKSHSTKIFSIMLVASLSLFSAHWATYFAAIFIVATAVTELEFLQNLAAIIRKDENYFNYKKEALSKTENIRRKAEEALEEEFTAESESDQTETQTTKIDLSQIQELSRASRMRLSFEVEEKALNYLEGEFGQIERGVRFRKDGKTVEFDGVITKKDGRENTVFEVKWSRNSDHTFMLVNHSLRFAQEQIERHEDITGRKPKFCLVVVTNTKTSLSSERKIRLIERAEESGIELKILSLTEIGIEVTHEIA